MKLRPAVIALALASVAALLLSGCGPVKTGSAAIIGETAISVGDVNARVYELGEDALAQTQFGTTANQVSYARNLVLSYSVSAEVTTQALDKLGIHPTDAQRNAAHDDALSYIYQNPDALTGGAADAQLASYLDSYGIHTDFLDTIVRFGEQMSLIAAQLHVSGISAVGAQIAKLGIRVRVNPRFGSWSFEQMTTVPGAIVPPFISSGASAAPAS